MPKPLQYSAAFEAMLWLRSDSAAKMFGEQKLRNGSESATRITTRYSWRSRHLNARGVGSDHVVRRGAESRPLMLNENAGYRKGKLVDAVAAKRQLGMEYLSYDAMSPEVEALGDPVGNRVP
jgi:hypothetical protein